MILVTGATGMLGAHFLLHLAQQGKAVRGFYRSDHGIEEVKRFFKAKNSAPLFEAIQWVGTELDRIETLDKALDGCTSVIHCAALVSFDRKDRKQLYHSNVLTTRILVDALIEKKIGITLISSIAAENEGSTSYYGYTKYLSELEVHRGAQEGIASSIIRPGVILGSHFWKRPSGRVIRNLCRPFVKVPTGKTGWVSADAVVKCSLWATEKLNSQTVTLVAANLSYFELATKISSLVGNKVSKQPIKKSSLQLAGWLEFLASLITQKKRKLTPEIIEAMCNSSEYELITDQKEFEGLAIDSFENDLKEIVAAYTHQKR